MGTFDPNTSSAGPSILIVDDSAEWRTCERAILNEQRELQVVAEARDGLQAVSKAAELQPDLVLLDIRMPHLNGLDAAEQIQQISPQSKIVFVTQESDDEIRTAALAAGAHGYVLKIYAHSKLLITTAAVLRDGRRPS